MNRTEKHAAILNHFGAMGYEVVRWKEGYWLCKDGRKTFLTAARAARAAGIQLTSRQTQIALPWGDYATIAMLNQRHHK